MSSDDESEALIGALSDELAYRVRTAVALSKGGHDIEAQVTEGRGSIERIVFGFRCHPQPTENECPDCSAKPARCCPTHGLHSTPHRGCIL